MKKGKRKEVTPGSLPEVRGSMFMPQYYGDDIGFSTSEEDARSRIPDISTGVGEDMEVYGRTEDVHSDDLEDTESRKKVRKNGK